MNKAIFIDKDGTLIHDVPYNVDPALVEFEEGAMEALGRFRDAGFLIVIISNQSGIGRGYFTEFDLEKIILHLKNELQNNGILLSGFYFCPHHPDDTSHNCDCRKPKPGMILRAAGDLGVEVKNSWMIGDILHDVEAGNRAGCKTILIDNGNETEWQAGEFRTPDFKVLNLMSAADCILQSA
jgi:D-glycero-D-manno-heptose 1,7-bisphosphate phosphatase